MGRATEVYEAHTPYFCECGQMFARISKGHRFGYPHPPNQLVLFYCGQCDVWLEAPEFIRTTHTYEIEEKLK